jgi:hypothetical protein
MFKRNLLRQVHVKQHAMTSNSRANPYHPFLLSDDGRQPSPSPLDISEPTYKLYTTYYLDNDEVSTGFTTPEVGDVHLHYRKAKATYTIHKKLGIAYEDIEFVKVESELSHEDLLKTNWPVQYIEVEHDWEGVENCLASWMGSVNTAICVNNC